MYLLQRYKQCPVLLLVHRRSYSPGTCLLLLLFFPLAQRKVCANVNILLFHSQFVQAGHKELPHGKILSRISTLHLAGQVRYIFLYDHTKTTHAHIYRIYPHINAFSLTHIDRMQWYICWATVACRRRACPTAQFTSRILTVPPVR